MTAMGRIPPGVRAVFFDAVGTLIHPEPSAATAYFEVGRRFGSRLDLAEVRRRFVHHFAEQEKFDALHGHRTSEEREGDRWRRLVASVLDDVTDGPECFRLLYEHFARPASWRCEVGAAEVLGALRAAGCRTGLASNFDRRLWAVADGLPELAGLDHIVVSSEVGWKKPSREFFATVCACVDLSPHQVLLVGDDEENDYAGARAAGLQALLFDPGGKSMLPPGRRLSSLAELLAPGA